VITVIHPERLLLAALAAGIAEASLGFFRAAPRVMPLATVAGAFLIAALCSLAVAVVVWAIAWVFARAVRELRTPWNTSAPRGFAGWVAAIALLPIVLALSTVAGRFLTAAFSNAELSALLSALSTLATAALAAAAWVLVRATLSRMLESRRSRGVAVCGLAVYLALVVLGSARAVGFTQLDPGLLLTAAAVLLAFLASRRALRPAPWLLATMLSIPIALAAARQPSEPSPFSLLARHGSWSKATVFRARGLVDRDGDGFSAWFAGGDCDDRDPRVHPGAKEIARDGVDNDCFGGDAADPPRSSAPRLLDVPAAVPGRPNLVLVTIETLRPDHLSLFGYTRPTTPRLEALAPSSVVFERAYAAAPGTRLSLAALLSGRTPSSLGWLPQPAARQMRRLAPDNPWLPELLARSGYRTLAVLANFRLFTGVENAGFERGFEVYDCSSELSFTGGAMQGFPGNAQVNRALELLDASDARPFALWLHLFEPHHRYEQSPHVARFGDDELARYDAEIAEADRQLGRLVDGLVARVLLDRTLLVVSGDHGEEFGEHGGRFHATNLYEAQVRTALLIRVPGIDPARVRDPVVLTDLAPTLTELLRVPAIGGAVEGRNLLPLLTRGEPPGTGFFLENFRVESGAQRTTALVEWPFKLIYEHEGRTFELYDLERDPLERSNLYQPPSGTADRLVARLHDRLERGAPTSPVGTP
jgi:arylsulfatase A-like enzyme